MNNQENVKLKYISTETHKDKPTSEDESDAGDDVLEKKSLKDHDDDTDEFSSNRLTRALNSCWESLTIECIPERYKFAIISSFGFLFVYAMRVNLSVALVAMVGAHSDKELNMANIACSELLALRLDNSTLQSNSTTMWHPEFDWDSTQQSFVLGAFFYGYVITQIPGGIIAEKFGGKMVFGLGVFITALFTLVTPFVARWGTEYLIAVRFIEGLGEGVTYPAMNALIGRWVPKNERSRIATIIYTGSPIGTVVSLALSGYLSASNVLGGWPMAFYTFGAGGCLWFICWILCVYESPREHPRISKAELNYIEGGQDRASLGVRSPTPWCDILKSRRVWALTITHFGFNWGFYTLLTELPTYLSNILHFDLTHNGLLSALPYLFQAIVAQIAGAIADFWRSRGSHNITTIRKVMNSIAFYVPAVLVGCLYFAGCDTFVNVALIMLAVAFSGFMYSGFNVTHVDMSPDFAGTLMGITNCVANIAGFLAPAVVGVVTKTGQTTENWQFVFLITSLVYVVSGLIFILFGSAELQPWGLSTIPAATPTDEENRESPE